MLQWKQVRARALCMWAGLRRGAGAKRRRGGGGSEVSTALAGTRSPPSGSYPALPAAAGGSPAPARRRSPGASRLPSPAPSCSCERPGGAGARSAQLPGQQRKLAEVSLPEPPAATASSAVVGRNRLPSAPHGREGRPCGALLPHSARPPSSSRCTR